MSWFRKGESRPKRRTGAASTVRADNIHVYRVAVVLLCTAVVGGGVGSVEGLLHAASWAEPWHLQWTLPAAVDIFLIGAALATLALRERRAYVAAVACALITIGLVTFSSYVNFTYVQSISDPTTTAGQMGPWIKAAMPWLTLLALEIIAALTSTRNNRADSPLNRAKRDKAKLAAEVRQLKKQLGKRHAPAPTEEVLP